MRNIHFLWIFLIISGLVLGIIISEQSSAYSNVISENNFFLSSVLMSYETTNKEVVIKDENNIEIMRANLITPLVYKVIDRGPGIKQKVAEIHFTILDKNYTFDNIFTKIYLYNIKESMNEFNRPVEYRLRVETGSYNYPVTEITCSNIIEKNGTAQKCTTEIIKYNNVTTHDYIPINSVNDLPAGEFVLALFTDVQPGDNVEWIPSYFGDTNKLEQWAVWTEGLNNGLRAYYRLNETSGTLALDSVDGNPNATFTGGQVGQSGIISNGYAMTTTDDSLDLNTNLFNTTTDNVTLSFWTYSNSLVDTSYYWAADDLTSNDPECMLRYEGNTRIQCYSDGPALQFQYLSSGLIANVWQHWVIQWTNDGNGNATIWLNGTILTSDASVSITTTENTDALEFGQRTFGSGNSANFTLDEIGWWDRYLTPSEIQDLYNNGNGISYDPSPECNYQGGNWEITSYCQHSNTGFNISGNLTISSGGTLNLTNVTLNFNSTNQWIIFDNVANENKLILNEYSRIN